MLKHFYGNLLPGGSLSKAASVRFYCMENYAGLNVKRFLIFKTCEGHKSECKVC